MVTTQVFKKLRTALLTSAFLFTASTVSAQDIKLPAPDKAGGSSMMETLWQRKSERQFSDKQLSQQQLSNLLWAACGISRPDSKKRTNPTARNSQEISVYAFMPEGVYHYDHEAHALKMQVKGDHRDIVADGQAFARQAPLTLLIVVDMDKLGSNRESSQAMGAADAGIVSQNINLFCAAYGLATVTRGTMNRDAIAKLLNLSEKQLPLLNNPVGYAK